MVLLYTMCLNVNQQKENENRVNWKSEKKKKKRKWEKEKGLRWAKTKRKTAILIYELPDRCVLYFLFALIHDAFIRPSIVHPKCALTLNPCQRTLATYIFASHVCICCVMWTPSPISSSPFAYFFFSIHIHIYTHIFFGRKTEKYKI